MTRRDQILLLVLAAFVLGAIKVGEGVFRWYAYGEERAALVGFADRLEDAAVGVIATQVSADTLRTRIEEMDEELGLSRKRLSGQERELPFGGGSPPGVRRAYRGDLAAYNRRVAERNALFREWRHAVEANHLYVEQYNELADTIRAIARQMGEPYYSIPSPAEVALRRGWMMEEEP